MNGKGTRGHEGEGRCVRIGREDAGDVMGTAPQPLERSFAC
jgi:hypothetical protein